MPTYNRTFALNPAPGGDLVKEAIAGLDADLTGAFTNLNLSAPLESPALIGAPTAPTQAANDSSTKLATTAFVDTSFAKKTGAVLTEPTATTPAAGDSSDKVATTAFVAAAAFSATLPGVAGLLALLAGLTVTSTTYNGDNTLNEVTYSTGHKEIMGYTGSNLTTVVYKDINGTTTLYTATITYTNGNISAVTWS